MAALNGRYDTLDRTAEGDNMRKLFESTLISLDGAVDNPGSWAMRYFNEESRQEATEQLRRSDAMLMGRNTYLALAAQWANADGEFADAINRITKYVFSSTLERPVWSNTELITTDLPETVAKLKADGDGDLTLYGHGQLSRTLLEHSLLDEIMLSVHPVTANSSASGFTVPERARLTLRESHARKSGVVVTTYAVSYT
ncbi:dihydrofolate reductase family protein [Nocardia bhagyanarayanae]|uniref:dihydrofolate reductase family protein n=1 Tax=Nocardia bhagyanarayanae TaxID=1215925 RepID=UPI0016399206|nr:dihydrofolate reductase family protein [Nocardia bhagyanarayanae]